MATWDESELKNETCSNCGAIYAVRYKSLPLKDDDQFNCACGQLLKSWRETGMYMYTRVDGNK